VNSQAALVQEKWHESVRGLYPRRTRERIRTYSIGRKHCMRHYFLTSVLLVFVVFTTSCDEESIRQLGAKLAISGQGASQSAVTALTNLDALEAVDYQQRGVVKIVVLSPELLQTPGANINKLVTVRHNDELAGAIATRVKAYKLFGKAYASLQRLSETKFADQAATAESDLINAFNAVKGLPRVPSAVTSLVPDVSRIIINRKQAEDIKKANFSLYQLCHVYDALWEADRTIWDEYMTAVENEYLLSLTSVPPSRFDEKSLREAVKLPYTQPYLSYLYKQQEYARLDNQMRQIKDQLDSVDTALNMLLKSHKELASEKPSFSDVIGTLDQMTTVLSDVKALSRGEQK
jgi:hypothetical protein